MPVSTSFVTRADADERAVADVSFAQHLPFLNAEEVSGITSAQHSAVDVSIDGEIFVSSRELRKQMPSKQLRNQRRRQLRNNSFDNSFENSFYRSSLGTSFESSFETGAMRTRSGTH